MTPNYPSPAELKGCRRGAEWAAAVAAAVDVGIFDALSSGRRSLDELAQALELDRRALEIVFGVLEALNVVQLRGNLAQLSEEGRRLYVEQGPGNEALATRRWRNSMRKWLYLDRVLKGSPPRGPDTGPAAQQREPLDTFMAAMASKPSQQVTQLVDACLRRHPGALSVLDLGGGPGVHAQAFLQRGLRATLFDTPDTIEYVAEAYQLASDDKLELVAGDFLESLPTGRYDVTLLSNITHIYSAPENASLISRLARVQQPGGLIAIMDFVRGVSPFAPLFAVNMLLKTEGGNTYSLDTYQAWLESAGYGAVELESLDEDRQLITALLD